MAALLSLRGLKARGLAPFDLAVEHGECVAVLGPSGSGKSVLMRAIADLDASDGEAFLETDGRDAMPAPKWRAQVGYLAPVPGWWEDRVGAHFPDPDEAAPLLEALGLPAEALDWLVGRLSTGEQQRLALARLLVGMPRVMLLDEPTSGLDAKAQKAAETVLRERLAAGAAILIVTHDRAQAKRLATRILEISGGEVREVAP